MPAEEDHTIDMSVLTPRQRLIIVLHYYCDWTYVEIAQAIGTTDAVLSKEAFRARSRLKGDKHT